MKKIMGLMLGMSLVLGSVSFAFAQDTTNTTSTKKMKKGKKKGTSGTNTSTTM